MNMTVKEFLTITLVAGLSGGIAGALLSYWISCPCNCP